jgi:putative oxidoreductase
MDLGLLLVRIVFGAVMSAHGMQKLFGWFGGHGIAGTGGYFEGLGFRPGKAFAAAAGASETVGGLLLALGLVTPAAGALLVSVMIVAAVSVHWPHGLFAMSNGIEVALLYGVAAAGIALTGPGAYSLDHALGLDAAWRPELAGVLLAAGVAGGFGSLVVRGRPQAVRA